MRNLSYEQLIIYGAVVKRYYNIIPPVLARAIPRVQNINPYVHTRVILFPKI